MVDQHEQKVTSASWIDFTDLRRRLEESGIQVKAAEDKTFQPDAIDELKIPPNVPWLLLLFPGESIGAEFQDFCLEVVGIRRNSVPQRPQWPVYRIESLILQVRRYRVFRRDIPQHAQIFAELVCSPSLDIQIRICGLERLDSRRWNDEIKKILPAMRLLGKRELRGGDRQAKKNQFYWNDQKCRQFARRVNELIPLWKWIKEQCESYESPNFSTAEWLADLKERTDFKKQTKNCKKITDDLIGSVADKSINKRNREAVALACVHAAHELDYPILSSDRLRTYYYRGRKLLTH